MNVLRYYGRRTFAALRHMRTRGYAPVAAVLIHLPRATLLRGWRIFARGVNRSAPVRKLNERSLRRVHAVDPDHAAGGHFYVIVMPGTLHFLLPCLALLPSGLRVRLIANGARGWERRMLAHWFPALPLCRLRTLPWTSATHGDVVSLLLATNRGNFGLLDHDCYVFDSALFTDLDPGPGQCLTAIWGGTSEKTGLTYPETYFLYLATTVLQEIAARYRVDARNYRVIPAHLRPVIARMGVVGGVFVKDHATFFDTLHLMLMLAIGEGYDFRFLQCADERSITHLGGTSWRTEETKDLIDCYRDWRFLESVDDAQLRRRYARRFRPFRSAIDVRAVMPMTPRNFDLMTRLDELVDRLGAPIARCRPTPAASASASHTD